MDLFSYGIDSSQWCNGSRGWVQGLLKANYFTWAFYE